MNENLIALLALKATRDKGWLDRQLFAELIVKECARVAKATPCPYTDARMVQHLNHTWNMACTEAGNEIVRAFSKRN